MKEWRRNTDTPGVVLLVQGATQYDMTYTHETEGSFNVTDAYDYALEHAGRFMVPLPKEEGEAMCRDNDLNPQRLDYYRAQRQFQPLLCKECADGTLLIIDGHHRLRVILERGESSFAALILTKEQGELFRVRYAVEFMGHVRELPPLELITFMKGIHVNPGDPLFHQ